MPENGFEPCHFEVNKLNGRYITQEGLYIQKNGGPGEYLTPNDLAKRGVEFPHTGPNASLWLVRDTQAMKIAERADNQLSMPYFSRFSSAMEPSGLRIMPNGIYLSEGDGFVILEEGASVEAGPINREDYRPRPTMRIKRSS